MKRLLSHVGPPLRAVRAVIGNPAIRRMQLAFLLFNVAEPAMWVGVLLFAFDRGGTRAVGLVTLLCLVPAGVLAPVAASLGDRFPRERVVRFGYLAQSVATLGVAAAIAMHAPPWSTYVLAAVSAATFTTGRPNHHALMPSLATTPEEVAAANSVSALMEGIGYILGGLAAAALATIGPAAIEGVASAALALAAVGTLGVHGDAGPRPKGALHPWTLVADTFEGLGAVFRAPGPRLLSFVFGAVTVATGAVGVLMVPLAVQHLGLGDPGVGLLTTAESVGLFVGAGISIGFATRKRVATGVFAAAFGYAIGVAVFGVADATIVAICGAIVFGAGMTLMDVLARTLLQRTTDEALLTRAFGVVEAMWLLAFAAGAAVAPLLESAVGLGATFLVIGGLFLAVTVLILPGIRRIDAAAVIPERQLALLGRIPFFALVPRVDLERLAGRLTRIETPTGTPVIREGDVGDRFYIVEAGTFAIESSGRRIDTTGEGGYFGEIALLRDVPRTATVRALDEGAVWALDREEFLESVTGVSQASAAAHAISEERLRGLEPD